MIVLDTHAWLWWTAAPEKLSRRARTAIEDDDDLLVSAISCWEIAMLVARKRLALDRDVVAWIRQALAQPKVELAPLSPEIAVRAVQLDPFHKDPADRMIVATALHHRATVLSKDDRIRSSELVDVVW